MDRYPKWFWLVIVAMVLCVIIDIRISSHLEKIVSSQSSYAITNAIIKGNKGQEIDGVSILNTRSGKITVCLWKTETNDKYTDLGIKKFESRKMDKNFSHYADFLYTEIKETVDNSSDAVWFETGTYPLVKRLVCKRPK